MTETCEWNDLVERDGLHYKNSFFLIFLGVPFTGKVTGREQGSIKNGKRHGPWVEYHENGQVWLKGIYKDGKLDGPWVGYNENGQLESKGTYKDGKMDGPWVGYWSNGTVSSSDTGTFKDGVKVK